MQAGDRRLGRLVVGPVDAEAGAVVLEHRVHGGRVVDRDPVQNGRADIDPLGAETVEHDPSPSTHRTQVLRSPA